MISLKQKDDYSDKTDTATSELQMQVPCDENAHSNPDSSAAQHPIPCSDKLHEEINNTEDKESLMDGNLKVGVMEDHKLSVYDSKRLAKSIKKDVYKVVIGTTWSNISCNKQPSSENADSSCDAPAEGSPATQDGSEKLDTPATKNSPATPQTENELSTTDSPATQAAEQSPATEMHSSPAIPTRGDLTKLVSDSVSDKQEGGPSGEDGKSSNANVDVNAAPCGEDQVDCCGCSDPLSPQYENSGNLQQRNTGEEHDSVQHEEAIASMPNEIPIGECESNLTPTEVATANKTPVGEGEPDCDGPSGQDEIEEVKMPLQSNDITCGQGKTLPTCIHQTTTGACSSSNHLPTNTKSTVTVTSVPAESESDSVEGRACLDNSATSSNAGKANVTSTESTTASLLLASEALFRDAPCTDTPHSASDECNVNTPDECHKELSDIAEDVSLAEQAVVGSVAPNDSCTNTFPPDVKPDDVHKATETGGTVDAHTEAESEECHHAAGPDGIVTCQPNGQDTTLVSCGDHTNSSAIMEADGNADYSSGSFTNAVPDDRTNEKSTYSGEECSDFVSSAPREDANALPSSSKNKASCIETSTHMRTIDLLFTKLIVMHFMWPALAQDEAANLTSSNVTEIDSMTVENSSEAFPVAGQSTMLGVWWIVAISLIIEFLGIVYMHQFARRQSIFFRWYTIIVGCLIKRHSGQQVEAVLPLTSATNIQNNATNSVKQCLMPPSTPRRANERFSSSVEVLSSNVSGKHTQQSVESGYHSMTPAPCSHIALPSGKDGCVPINREPLRSRLNPQSTSVQSEISQSTELDSTDVLEPVSFQLTDKKRRVDHSIKIEPTKAENYDPGGEFVSINFHRKERRTTTSRQLQGAEQEVTQPGERSSKLAGLMRQRRERTVQVLPPVVIPYIEVPPQINVEPSPVLTIALPINSDRQVLAFNAVVEETEHEAPDLPVDVSNLAPITLESSFVNLEQGLRPHIGLADAEVGMFQLQPPPFARPYAAQGDAADCAPVYPPLPGVPFANAELQPVFPPLPALPSMSTPMVVIPITYVP